MNFGDFDSFTFETPFKLINIIKMQLESPEHAERCEKIVRILTSKSEMLKDYFSLEIDPENQTLNSLPLLLPDYTPQLEGLPGFLIRLAENVDWKQEQRCLQ